MSKWTEDFVNTLVDVVGEDKGVEVPLETVKTLSEQFDFSERSVAAKLRHLGYAVEKVESVRQKTFSEEQEEALRNFVSSNSGLYTYAEIAAHLFADSEVTPRMVQGKLLSMDLVDHVKPTEHAPVERVFSEAEEEIIISMAEAGAYLEDIAEALGKELKSVRGKALSLFRKEQIEQIPVQRDVKVTDASDPISTIEDVEKKTVQEIAEILNKSERGVKTMLTKRGIKVANYDGAKRHEKNVQKKEAA